MSVPARTELAGFGIDDLWIRALSLGVLGELQTFNPVAYETEFTSQSKVPGLCSASGPKRTFHLTENCTFFTLTHMGGSA